MFAYTYTGVPAQTLRQKLDAVAPGLLVAAGFAGACAVDLANDPTRAGNGFVPICPSKLLFGIDCPGCGGQRMLYCALHGDFGAALHYNAVSFVVLLLMVWSTVTWIVGRWRGRHMRSWLHWRWAPLAFGIVIVLWWVVRNLPFAPFTSLYV